MRARARSSVKPNHDPVCLQTGATGLAVRRQMPIAGFIVDSACQAKKLVVELDGSRHGHDDVRGRDEVRSASPDAHGWTILRLWNDDVLRDIDGVSRHIVIRSGLMAEGAAQAAEHGEHH